MAYRSSLHSSTKETPATLMFGREMRLPVDVMFNDPRDASKSVNDHLCELKLSLQQSYSHARAAGAQAQRRQKDYYDHKSTPPRFAVGDKVRLHNPAVKPGTTKKFYLPWTGPYELLSLMMLITES